MGLLVFGLGAIPIWGARAPLAPAPPSWFNDCFFQFALSFARFKGILEQFGTFGPTMTLLPTVKTMAPLVCFICPCQLQLCSIPHRIPCLCRTRSLGVDWAHLVPGLGAVHQCA